MFFLFSWYYKLRRVACRRRLIWQKRQRIGYLTRCRFRLIPEDTTLNLENRLMFLPLGRHVNKSLGICHSMIITCIDAWSTQWLYQQTDKRSSVLTGSPIDGPHMKCASFNYILYLTHFYRVAQIKIPHRTKCNFSTTVWDFYTQITWFTFLIYNSKIKKKYFSFLKSYG